MKGIPGLLPEICTFRLKLKERQKPVRITQSKIMSANLSYRQAKMKPQLRLTTKMQWKITI
jgi:hypothetical protein